MEKLSFEDWANQLQKVVELKDQQECYVYSDLMYSLTGKEDLKYLQKVIDSIILLDDYGLYESTFNAIWCFPAKTIGSLLAERLPELQRKMGRYDQVFRFYIPLINEGEAQDAFIEAANKWNSSEKRTGLLALRKWAIEEEEVELLLARLGKPLPKEKEDPIPEEWTEDWKERLKLGRDGEGEFSISEKFWKGGKENWKKDLDFLIEVCAMNQGKKWRQIDTITNPFWFFAKTTMYPEFVKRIKKLDEDKRTKLLNNIKKANKRKYIQLIADLEK